MEINQFCKYISKLAVKSLIYEVSATPKPGLVDRNNPGAHRDMDFFTFIDSSLELTDYFYECTYIGSNFYNEDKTMLLKEIRPRGIKAENDMFLATKGVNTHKGLIFSVGIICAAVGHIFREKPSIYISSQDICSLVKMISQGITSELENLDGKEELTYGERLFIKYGSKGIRGEAETGFKTVTDHSLPIMKTLMKEELHINDVLVQVLLNLMATTEDSNILGRHNMETLSFVRDKAKTVLKHGGYLTLAGKLLVEDMDKSFIKKNISPGGSADLMAITIMLYMLEEGDTFE